MINEDFGDLERVAVGTSKGSNCVVGRGLVPHGEKRAKQRRVFGPREIRRDQLLKYAGLKGFLVPAAFQVPKDIEP